VLRIQNLIIPPGVKSSKNKNWTLDIQDLQGVEGGVRVLVVEFLLYRGHRIPDQGEK
jgi:hypothetical protein